MGLPLLLLLLLLLRLLRWSVGSCSERKGRRHEENKLFGAVDASGNLEGKYANWDSLGFQGALPKLMFLLIKKIFLEDGDS